MKIRIKKLHPDAILPTRKHPGDSGMDLCALLPDGPINLAPGERKRINTGIAVELPLPRTLCSETIGTPELGWEAQVRSRSGLTSQGIVACGGLGTVDNGYRGDIGVTLFNHSFQSFIVRPGDRIAQLVVVPVVYPEAEEVTELSETARGDGGFGSTGR